jgi:hypothetical protein
MITHSMSGMVSTKIGRDLTILLTTGVKVKLRVKTTSLRLGDKVHVIYNHETGKVKEVLAEGEAMANPNAIESLPWDDTPFPDDTLIGDLEMGVFSGTGE